MKDLLLMIMRAVTLSKNSPRLWFESRFIFIIIIGVLHTHILLIRHAEGLNCSEPTFVSLLNSLKDSVFFKTEIRPVKNPQTPTNVTVDLYIYGILGVDEKTQVLETFIWVYLYWDLEGLYWDPEECGTDRISLPRSSVWMPDIIINEFMDENRAPPTYYLYVNNSGQVEDGQTFHLISSCNLNIYTFPFDIQNCNFSFYSYMHRAADIQLHFPSYVTSFYENSLYTIGTNGEWELIDLIPVKPPKDPDFNPKDSWDSLVFQIILKRKASVYVVNLLLPSCFLAALDVLSALLPVQHVDRSAFKMTLILGYTVFLLLMNDLLPVTGNNIPLINVFFSVCLALMVVSLMETLIITNIVCNAAEYPTMPRWLRLLVLQGLAYLLCMQRDEKPSVSKKGVDDGVGDGDGVGVGVGNSVGVSSSEKAMLQELRNISKDLSSVRQKIDEHLSTNPKSEEWIHLALVIDRCFLAIYALFLSTSFTTILVLWLQYYLKSRPNI